MLVYGDAAANEDVRDKRERITVGLREAAALEPGLVRHGALVAAFIEAGELLQGVADLAFADRGCDAPTPAQDAVMALLMALAGAVRGSWRSGFRASAPFPDHALTRVEGSEGLPARIRVKRPEGYAFYALYPEAYLETARGFGSAPDAQIIGLRSIGTGLAAAVAVEWGAPPPVTVRPVGHPFRRELALAPALADALTANPAARYAVVDEGPGLSGSSFGAVMDCLEERGVAPERIHAFPGHAGDLGPQATPRHRARWAKVKRPVVDFETLVLRAPDPAHRLETWAADLVGAPLGPLEDLSGGAWRARVFSNEAAWPACHVQQERRKFLLRTETGTWLLKFSGLGREGARKLDRAQALHAAGFTPEVLGCRHGFLVERWLDARPLDPRTVDRATMIDTVGRYLGFRARRFPAGAGQGASLAQLLEMARVNTGLALGDAAARRLDRFESWVAGLEGRVRRIETDNRLHAWEWLHRPDDRLLKTDALDHHAAHDLVGCQDVAWDVAGAAVELGLDDAEQRTLCAVVERAAGRALHHGLLDMSLPCYLAFQMGHHALAADALAGWPEEAARLRAASERYAGRLRTALGAWG